MVCWLSFILTVLEKIHIRVTEGNLVLCLMKKDILYNCVRLIIQPVLSCCKICLSSKNIKTDEVCQVTKNAF